MTPNSALATGGHSKEQEQEQEQEQAQEQEQEQNLASIALTIRK